LFRCMKRETVAARHALRTTPDGAINPANDDRNVSPKCA
jgi:hypothetical protein